MPYPPLHTLCSLQLLLSLLTKPNFKSFLEQIQRHPACNNMNLESVLAAPLKRMEAYIHDLQELRSHTPIEHIDYNILQETISELEIIQKVRGDPLVYIHPLPSSQPNWLHAFVLIPVISVIPRV